MGAAGGVPHVHFAPGIAGGAAQPQAAALPAAIFGAPPANARPYRDWYADHTRDPFIGNYTAIYDKYAITQANTPTVVRDRIFANGNNGVPIGHALLVYPANAGVDDPEKIQGFHRAVRFQPGLIAQTVFDDVGYAFLGDVHNGQAPHTVVWDNDYFARVGTTQVPTPAALDQIIAQEPDEDQYGPFAAGTPDTELVNVRYCCFVPNRYMTMLLEDSMTPREA